MPRETIKGIALVIRNEAIEQADRYSELLACPKRRQDVVVTLACEAISNFSHAWRDRDDVPISAWVLRLSPLTIPAPLCLGDNVPFLILRLTKRLVLGEKRKGKKKLRVSWTAMLKS